MKKIGKVIPIISKIERKIAIDNLNEICYRGFDELNALIQEERWVRNKISYCLSY